MTNKPYSILECPECDNKGDFMKDDNEEFYCIHCGLVIESPYPYSAGIRFKTLSEILDDENDKEIKNKQWRRENARLKKLQKI